MVRIAACLLAGCLVLTACGSSAATTAIEDTADVPEPVGAVEANDPVEAELLQAVVESQNATDQVWAVYGAPGAVETYVSNTETPGFSEGASEHAWSSLARWDWDRHQSRSR